MNDNNYMDDVQAYINLFPPEQHPELIRKFILYQKAIERGENVAFVDFGFPLPPGMIDEEIEHSVENLNTQEPVIEQKPELLNETPDSLNIPENPFHGLTPDEEKARVAYNKEQAQILEEKKARGEWPRPKPEKKRLSFGIDLKDYELLAEKAGKKGPGPFARVIIREYLYDHNYPKNDMVAYSAYDVLRKATQRTEGDLTWQQAIRCLHLTLKFNTVEASKVLQAIVKEGFASREKGDTIHIHEKRQDGMMAMIRGAFGM